MATNGKPHVISTMAELEALYADPVYPPAKVKETDRITKAYRALIEASPFFALATNGPNGPIAAAPTDSEAEAASKPSVFNPNYGTDAPPTAPKGRKKPFVLDPLLDQ